jgi:hypothetical protein
LRSQAGDEKKREMKQKKLKKAKPAATRNGRMPWERKPFAQGQVRRETRDRKEKTTEGRGWFLANMGQ